MQAKFLICDDQKIRVQEIRQFLGANPKYTIVETFTNGREVADWVKRNPGKADVLILDIIMPVMDGYAAFFEIKQADPKLKVYFVSVENSPPLVKELAAQGAVGFSPKPLDRDKFVEKIKQIVGF
ncbi:response regulator [Leptonema illini]|jgi:DNA-binding NarL/FixJ family response regulator|uniref:Response regulator receiver protein n=1 Tax=Leptonema illini DSM 21528 TaxID=929563 RepID=H2CBY6_9LEPT|nr:response regulator [Leptonema illini]EHQ08658.1 response regulator receiver protein [Leptonema illini DSM 21528]